MNFKNKFLLLLFLSQLMGCVVIPSTSNSGGTDGWQWGEEQIFSKNWKNKKLLIRERQNREPGWELGIAFSPKIDGRITAFRIKNPTIGQVPITLWDADTQQIIYSTSFNNNLNQDFFRYLLSNPILVNANKKYYLTINVEKYFYFQDNIFLNGIVIENTHFNFLGSVFKETQYQQFPTHFTNDVIHGLVDIDAQWKVN